MKKLLVTLLLGAGFVTVASANERLYCDGTPSTNQCCNDFNDQQNVLNSQYFVPTKDDNKIIALGETLVNDGVDGTNCIDEDLYRITKNPNPIYDANFEWQPANWGNTIKLESESNPSSTNNPDARIITNN